MKALNVILVVVFTVALLLSCKDFETPAPSNVDNQTETDQVFSIGAARDWFQNSVVPSTGKNARVNGDKVFDKEAVWSFAVSRTLDKVGQIVIVPLKYTDEVPSVFFGSSKDKKKTPEKDINFSSRLVIWKNKRGEFEYRVHNVMPDENDQKKNGKTLKKDFSGMVTVTDLDGNFMEGYTYKNGKVTGKLSPKLKNGRVANTPCGGDPYTEREVLWYSRACVNGHCYEPRYMYTETYYICEQSDSGSDGVTPPPTVSSPSYITNHYNTNGQYLYQIDGTSGDPIDVREELKCFGVNSNPNSIFRVIIYVDQVRPGTRAIGLG